MTSTDNESPGKPEVDAASPVKSLPDDLVEYLLTMIAPPPEFGAPIYIPHLDLFDFAAQEDSSIVGILGCGTPTEEQAAEILRVLKPGAHLLLVAPDTQPTGHTGAIRVEDAGMEIRDAILLVQEPGRFHYVPKATRKEREAGCEHLKGKQGHEAVEREEGSAGLDSPRAGAGRTASHVKNYHPCLHPEALVLTERGYRPIQSIEKGDKVYTAEGTFHEVTWVTRHLYTSPDLFRISVQGTNLTTLASDNHPFLIWRPKRKGKSIVGGEVLWLPAEEIVKGDYTMTPVPVAGVGTNTVSADYERDVNQTTRKPARPVRVRHEGVEYTLRYVQGVERVPYQGDVVNLSVDGSPTFQTVVGMSHNTVKPVAVMEALLHDVPKDQGPVLDPFMGSGTTGIACVKTGHGFIGIEREAEYLEIADARIRYWNNATPKAPAPITSDHEVKEIEARQVDDLFDFFGE